jgi:hypothetical protein
VTRGSYARALLVQNKTPNNQDRMVGSIERAKMSRLKTLSSIAILALVCAGIGSDVTTATCYGDDPCNACKNCKYCAHCAKEGGTCGVCKRKQPIASFYHQLANAQTCISLFVPMRGQTTLARLMRACDASQIYERRYHPTCATFGGVDVSSNRQSHGRAHLRGIVLHLFPRA